ncbi:hypothetical protein K491DRAFT_320917 [Lophiostoma macrostomum CBS 122681]|uniref:Protein BNI4 n=1 Tax=Lophiostoma macrostomum CBS 122681 TaxID=1314788 RepID=A0A6A6TEB6_9PLEO|nr:hypothetical protein K491DRAFT_320917 [Lophiostoma macrostomum CBS 122681]
MAQVLSPIVQASGSITMIHSSADAFQNPPQSQSHHQQARTAQMPRGQMYNAQGGGPGYRGTSAPIAPYAFSSTPQLRQDGRSTSAPNPHALQQMNHARLGHPSHPSSSSDSTVSTSGSSSRSAAGAHYTSKDDSVIGSTEVRKSTVDSYPASAITLSASVPDLSLSIMDGPVKPSPDRYRRAGPRRTDSSPSTNTSATATPTQHSPLIGAPNGSGSSKLGNVPSLTTDLQAFSRPGHGRASSVDDMQISRQGAIDQARRYRRRSLSGLEVPQVGPQTPIEQHQKSPVVPSAKRPTQEFRPASSSSRHGSRPSSSQGHDRQGSAGSNSSTTSTRPSSRQESTTARTSPVSSPNAPSRAGHEPRRVIAPSPLSKPVSASEPPSPAKKVQESAATAAPPSAAMQHLTALNDKESSRGVKSRLRRAFSFGSAAELRRASAENNLSAERAKLRKDRYQNDIDAETAAIAAKQEAAGIGAGIYNGQGGFSGSTDNLSISSTASSASIMLRKMGSGMKKGGRSIKGLFRPKSVIGVPAADGPVVQASVGQVSMVTVEAERQKVNVNVDPHDQTGGGTGYPRLERNSLDAGRTTSESNGRLSSNDSFSRKSIVGGDRERAEVLSSIKKGILKRAATASETSSPIGRPSNETPKSSAPSTPIDDHTRPVQVHINGEDYFGRPPRLANPSTRSLPSSPQGSRNISFSPRIQFHDAWSSSDYDRRGEIATCNRLTPMLAQQIKEELNSFKMEMEVHESSKPHTHFF